MNEQLPGGAPRRFTPGELDDVPGMGPDDLAEDTRVARELEGAAARTAIAPSATFADRVMGAVAEEPSPAPAQAAGRALRRGAFGAFLLSVRDAWRVTIRPGFPAAVRAQAFAVVLAVLVVGTASAAATAGAIGLLGGDRATPAPTPDATIEAPRSPDPAMESDSPSPSMESVTPAESESLEPGESAGEESAEPERTAKPGESADDRGGGSGSGSGSGDDSAGSGSDDSESRTPRPTGTPKPAETQQPQETEKPSETPHTDDSGSSGASPNG